MLKQQLEKLSFYKGVKFEVKGKQLFARSANRTKLQEDTEAYFKKSRIKYSPRKKATELEVAGSSEILVFKPLLLRALVVLSLNIKLLKI